MIRKTVTALRGLLVLKTPVTAVLVSMLPLTPTQVRDRMAEMGYDLGKYKHVMPPIHNTLKRMKEAGEIKEVEGLGGIGRAYVSAK